MAATSVAIAQAGDETAAPAARSADASPSPADIALVAMLAGYVEHRAIEFVRSSDDITRFLPNVKYRDPDGTVRPPLDLVVRGGVIRVEPGAGFVNLPEALHGEYRETDVAAVAYDDPKADFRTVHLVVKVMEEIGDSDQVAPTELRVGVVLYHPIDLAALTRGLQAADSFVFFLYDGNPVFDPGVWAIAAHANLLTQVDRDGRLSLPGLDAKVAKGVLRKAGTLAQLKQFAAKPDQVRATPEGRALA